MMRMISIRWGDFWPPPLAKKKLTFVGTSPPYYNVCLQKLKFAEEFKKCVAGVKNWPELTLGNRPLLTAVTYELFTRKEYTEAEHCFWNSYPYPLLHVKKFPNISPIWLILVSFCPFAGDGLYRQCKFQHLLAPRSSFSVMNCDTQKSHSIK